MIRFLFLVFATLAISSYAYEVDTYDFTMPDVYPHRDELYLCTPIRISPKNNYYIVGFEPNATMHTAHHMLLYGCTEPGSNDLVWGCGEMQGSEDESYKHASPCKSGSQVVYAWARDAPSLQLPKDVGFLIGKDSPIKYLVLQVHYMSKFPSVRVGPRRAEPAATKGRWFSHREGFPHQVYTWAREATSLQLPKDVGFLIGKDSPIKYLVLQVHYMSKFPKGKTDNSGVYLKYTKAPMPRQAGIILLGTGGVIAKKSVVHMETACRINEDKVIHPFAFRTHTHALGTVVSGYVVRKHENGDEWQLIGRKNPQLPQMFYPVENEAPVHRGDILAARCTMNNTNGYPVKIGATNKHEMCNFYIMYWVERDSPLEQKYCFSPGPPYYHWTNAPENFNRIPDLDASKCEGVCMNTK
ncbi:putative peptidylglycine alpha-hydroxylating monooxygenase 1 [Phthorimaea operculella]|nr:putative peptidylglycine alpha-hydroxylating monooxygenase 1 [Phthorimaea operculella]